MDGPAAELDPALREQEHAGTGGPSSEDCGPVDSVVHPGPSGAPFWAGPPSDASLTGIPPHPLQLAFPLDPLSLRFHCPYQSTQCQVTFPDHLLENQSSQYHFLTDPVPGPSVSSHPSSFAAPWFSNEPALCSLMPEDLHIPVASICAPEAMDHKHVQERLTEVPSHITQPVVCNASEGGQVVLVNPCEPGPVFLTLESAQGKEVSVFGAPSQPPQHHQTACPLYKSRDQPANMQPGAPSAQDFGTLRESKFRKPCHCTRSQCLKLYCECFATGLMCSNCDCSNCHNNAENEMKRQKAIKSCLARNPDAFKPKIAGRKSGEVKGWHNKGCNCKRSSCLKNYCECYEANIMCTSSCKCVGCRNYDDGSKKGLREKTVKDKWPASVITPAVVETVCSCLLAQAEEAERGGRSPAQAEYMVLNEFGHCLTQIVKAMFKYDTH